jgi:hypothetical protein
VAVNSIYASIIPSYKYNLVLKSFSYGTLVMGHPVHYKQNSYFGPFERERALDENFSMFFFQVNLQWAADTL